ncbi:hypothetical protein QAD02_014118 [Eretmocerus hayati]|uniref:Uncharacterized protein n=1 Tax=Eretmocerus hayati TaxID=131215 RepID=A0ACC2P5L7_9HYME|nr:hypothetical protein QAD02_014118 [Eretmocerus hayati]
MMIPSDSNHSEQVTAPPQQNILDMIQEDSNIDNPQQKTTLSEHQQDRKRTRSLTASTCSGATEEILLASSSLMLAPKAPPKKQKVTSSAISEGTESQGTKHYNSRVQRHSSKTTNNDSLLILIRL